MAPRADLTPLTHDAVRTKGTILSALYHRVAAHLGKKRAILAVVHTTGVSVFHLLSMYGPYREWEANYFDHRGCNQLVDQLARRIARQGGIVYAVNR